MRTILLSFVFATCIEAADPPSIEKLVEQLGSRSFTERERATKALSERGPVVLPALRKALESKDEEVRKRAERLIPPLEITEALMPRPLSIKLENQPFSDAIKQLEEQTDYKFAWAPIGPGGGSKETVEFKNIDFWEALSRLRNDKGRIVCVGTSKKRVNPQGNHSPYSNIRGPFLLEAGWIHEDRDIDFTENGKAGKRDHRLTLSLNVEVEPRITFTKVGAAKIEEAIDSEGNSLMERSEDKPDPKLDIRSFVPPSGRGTFRGESLNFSDVRLQRASETAKTIKLLRGTVPIKAIVLRKPVVVTSKIAQSSGTAIRAGTETVTITRVNTQRGGNFFDIEFLVPYAQRNAQDWRERFKVTDDAGNEFQQNGWGSSSNGREYRMNLHFSPPRNKKDVGPPTKLIFEDWIMHDYEIPFEFKDLPLP